MSYANVEGAREESLPIYMLCCHGPSPEVLLVKYGCVNDEPIYPGDSVIQKTTYHSAVSADRVTTATIERAER